MLSNLAASLVAEERLITTDTRAKELRRVAEHLVTLAKRAEAAKADAQLSEAQKTAAGVHYRRLVFRTLKNEALVKKLFEVITPRFMKLPDGKPWGGGYTRVLKVGRRVGDNAPTALIEFIGAEVKRKIIKRAPEPEADAPEADGDE
jgi:large subunit ribosomal protein L17